MDSRAVLHPVGPLPARVYWVRRLVPLLVLFVLILVLAISCSGGSSAKRSTPATGTAATPTPTPSVTTTPRPCRSGDLEVTASTDAPKYATGTLPRLVVRVRNTGLTACTFADAPSRRVWTVVSGSDQIWTTAGCTASKTVTRHVVAAGESLRHSYVWNRHRSGKNCATSDTSAGPGTYQLLVTVNGIRSAPSVFHLTG